VTAQDVAFTFRTILKDGSPALRSYLSDIDRVEALDARTVKFFFKRKDNPEIALTVGEVPILSQADWQNRKFDEVSLKVPIGSGAYKIKSFEAGRVITYQRDPNYWAKDLPVNRGKYNFDQIKYTYYRSGEIAFEGFKAGQYRLRQENKARTWSVLYNFPAVQQGVVKKQLIRHQNPVAMQALVMNLRRAKFQDIRTRQALTLAFDFEWMNKAIFNKGYERLHSYWHNSELAATGTPSSDEMKLLSPLLPKLSAAVAIANQ
jgi:peptide/nickel transport system substrate-binding protein/microcin C transport system substrate-binding protein